MSETNCPNCGAPIEGIKCKYCGTYFFNLTDLDYDKPKYIRIPVGNSRCMFNVLADEISFTQEASPIRMYADEQLFVTMSPPECTLNIKLRVVPDDEGILMLRKEFGDVG